MQIKYNQINYIIGDRLISYNGKLYETLEDLKKFPADITLKELVIIPDNTDLYFNKLLEVI